MQVQRLLLILAVALAAAVIGVIAAQRLLANPEPELASVLPEPRVLPEFRLTDHRSEPFTRNDLTGQWDVLFFGYTHCPDICPPTLDMLNRMVEKLEAEGQTAPRVVFVSVDPERDTPERIAEYISYFNEDFVGATGSEEQLEGFARSVGVMSSRVEAEESETDYLVDHSGALIVVDPDGHQHAVLSTPLTHEMEAMATDFERIRRAYR